MENDVVLISEMEDKVDNEQVTCKEIDRVQYDKIYKEACSTFFQAKIDKRRKSKDLVRKTWKKFEKK